ncbi:hypothetical protein [Tenuibacillus multivorans]|nr:hypothetical protein [Tenuibacillus multivorans]
MVDAFFYMYVVGLGTALGVGTVVLIGWKVYQRQNKKSKRGRKAVV